jgi:hypothetical protein
MVLRWDGGVRKSRVGTRVNKDQKNIKAFSRVENIKVIVDRTMTDGLEEGEVPRSDRGGLYCEVVQRLFEFFIPHTARLSSIVILSRKVAVERPSKWWGPVAFTMRPEETSTGPVADRLSGLPLQHFAHALCLYSNIDHHYSVGWTDSYHSVRDSIYQLQVRYYAREPHKVLHPTPQEVQGLWKSYTISRDQAYTQRPPKRYELEAFTNPESRMWGWEEFSGEQVYAAKDVFRGDSVENDPCRRVKYERPGGPEYYFKWDEIMMDTSDDA